ncbi:glycosyl hydrolase family 28-related protein [Dactylosporangium sp. CA-233914]|uniref:glycosyl hydrolase family 28-related protein n=1 Tax=Dactylosporangium sp. CA-233914 TaxID=3239934 RepID=UPI003D8F4AE4
MTRPEGIVTDASTITYTASGTGAVTRNVAAKLGEAPSIIDYGGDPAGATDCTPAFNAALAAAAAGGGRRIYFPTGTYSFRSRPNQICGSPLAARTRTRPRSTSTAARRQAIPTAPEPTRSADVTSSALPATPS